MSYSLTIMISVSLLTPSFPLDSLGYYSYEHEAPWPCRSPRRLVYGCKVRHSDISVHTIIQISWKLVHVIYGNPPFFPPVIFSS